MRLKGEIKLIYSLAVAMFERNKLERDKERKKEGLKSPQSLLGTLIPEEVKGTRSVVGVNVAEEGVLIFLVNL